MKMIKVKLLVGIAGLTLIAQCYGLKAAGAGVLVSTVHNNQVLILLADHKKPSQVTRGWSTLGGTVKQGESELEAAIREVVEESNGILSSKLLLSAVNPDIRTVTPGFTIFYAQIPYQNIELFNQTEGKDAELVNNERGPFIWIPCEEILDAAKIYREQKSANVRSVVNLNKKYLVKNSQTDWFFNAFLATVKSIAETPQTKLCSL